LAGGNALNYPFLICQGEIEMSGIKIENRPDCPDINLYERGHLFKRSKKHLDNKGNHEWVEVIHSGKDEPILGEARRSLERLYRTHTDESVRRIHRFPRLTERINRFRDIPLTAQVETEPTRWLVKGLIVEGSINLLIAPPGGFKTWFGLCLGQAVSQGIEFLGRTTRRTSVVILDLENPQSAIRERLEILQSREGKRLRIWGHWFKLRPPLDGDRRLHRIARRDQPLIIIDSLIRFHSANEDKADQMATVMAGFRELTDAGATVLLLHHPAKAAKSKYRGSSDILAGVDAAFELAEGKNDTLKLECFKHRYIQEPTLNIRPDFKNGCFEVVDDPSNTMSVAVREKIIGVIERHPGITQKDLLRKARLPETNGRKALQQGDGIHWISKRGKGKTRRYYPKSRES
jgi:hypothetical protein